VGAHLDAVQAAKIGVVAVVAAVGNGAGNRFVGMVAVAAHKKILLYWGVGFGEKSRAAGCFRCRPLVLLWPRLTERYRRKSGSHPGFFREFLFSF
jgi:hypothetical protein